MSTIPRYVKIIEGNIKQQDLAFLSSYSQLGLLVDEQTLQHCYPLVKSLLPAHYLLEISSGEEAKNIDTCQSIWQQLTEQQFDRKALLLNFGGGVIGDMGGFCAATYKRGIAFVQMPTTLLAQVDASVGGKLGIDFLSLKNHIGVFQQPSRVLIYSKFLHTLPLNELRSGFAEVIKHGLIADKDYWHKIQSSSFQQHHFGQLIRHSVYIKAQVVNEDPHEQGLRKILNFGHTIGHAIEGYFLRQPSRKLLHGEAIAIGMICESFLSYKKCGLSEESLKQITDYLVATYGIVKLYSKDYEGIKSLIIQDKKNERGVINCSLLRAVGKCTSNCPINWEEISESLTYYSVLGKE